MLSIPSLLLPPFRRSFSIFVECEFIIIYLSRVLCLSYSCLSSCHNCGTLCYSFSFNNQTDSGDEGEGLKRELYRWRDRKGTDCRGRVWRDFSLFKPYLINMNVHSATFSCSVELYKQWCTLADFFPNWNFRGVFSTLFAVYLCTITQCVFKMHVCNTTIYKNKYKKRRIRRGRI